MFSFELNFIKQGEPTKALVIFSDSETLDESEYVEFFENAFKKHLRPDQVIYIFPGYICERVENLFKDGSLALNSANRFGGNVTFSLMHYNYKGVFECLNNTLWNEEELLEFRAKVCKEGLLILSKKNGVIELAPPGTTFKKPSEREDKEFLSASRLCSGSCEESFVSFSMLPMLPDDISGIRLALLDTQSISYIINNISLTLTKFGLPVNFSHKSFSSYSGIEKNKPDNLNTTIVVISASTTNSLMRELEQTWGISKDKITVILSYTNDERVLSDVSTLSSRKNKNDSSDRHVKRIGEHFTAEILAPKAVVIKKIHGKKISQTPFKELHNLNSFRCHKTKPNQTVRREFNIELDLGPKLTLEKIKTWLSSLAKNHIPASTKWIIIDKQDQVSEALASEIIKKIGRNKTSIKVVDFREVINIDFGNSKDALVAFAPVIGSGNVFMALNRDLRIAKHDGMRIFSTLVHLYKGKIKKINLKNRLYMAQTSVNINFSRDMKSILQHAMITPHGI
ncbi:hypothetical protein [Pseudomonas sp. NPDC099000]|uniref:hypothetical protein n=1 Tax=Pseudomonas sp. NPDC099000 TaxID=3364488 RepID=UPI00383AD25B